ncbi:hypothetical protein ZWY2020_047759 [Hordeum vulgare]|nr:hypothetical protein ZWY2020_047759 [Hordeum vulgare]
MAETVLSMARSMLGGAVNLAASAATAEMSLVMGVRKDIWFIKDELETMQVFLVAAERIKNKDMLLKVWAKQIRDLSYSIEDCLGEFMLHVGSQSLSWRLIKLKDRRRIAMQICELKSRVEEVSNRNIRYNLIKTESPNILEVDSYTDDVRTHLANNIDEAELVGFTKPKEQLIQLMDVDTKDGLAKVICVVGMGGLGESKVNVVQVEVAAAESSLLPKPGGALIVPTARVSEDNRSWQLDNPIASEADVIVLITGVSSQ